MNSYEFLQGLNSDNMYCIQTMFDATMALYQVIGKIDDIRIIDSGQSNNTAFIEYTIEGNSDRIIELVRDFTGLYVSIYNRTYIVTVANVNTNKMTLILQDTHIPEG